MWINDRYELIDEFWDEVKVSGTKEEVDEWLERYDPFHYMSPHHGSKYKLRCNGGARVIYPYYGQEI